MSTLAIVGHHKGLLAAARCLALDSLAKDTFNLLATAGIESILLKGPATSARLYGDQSDQRFYTDVDLLVAPERFRDAEELLAESGYRLRYLGMREHEMLWHERPWCAPDVDLTIDLHRGFAGVQDPSALWKELWETRDSLAVAGHPIAVPGAAGTALILTLHAGAPGPSTKPLADLVRAREVFSFEVWGRAVELSRLVGAEGACRAGLELLPDGPELAGQLGLTASVPLRIWLTGHSTSGLAVSIATAFDQSSIRELAAYVQRKLLPSPAFLLKYEAGARSGPRGVAAAYLKRWCRAIVSLPRALIEVRRGRREVRNGDSHFRAVRSIVSSPQALRTLFWALRMVGQVRAQLIDRPFAEVEISKPPATDAAARAAVQKAIRIRHATCLEKSLLRQRFDAAAGRDRALIVAVTAPGNGFRAHSWLDGELQRDSSLREIVRHPAPPHWFPTAQRLPGPLSLEPLQRSCPEEDPT